MAVTMSINGYSTVLFAYAGRTMIGKLHGPKAIGTTGQTEIKYPAVVTDSNGIIGSFIKDEKAREEFYFIEAPCVVDYSIEKPKTGSAKLKWMLTPYFYKALVASSDLGSIIFAFPKNQVVLSSVADDAINDGLRAAYVEICQ